VPQRVYLTVSDASKLTHGELTPAAFRSAIVRQQLEVAARTVGGIALLERAAVESYLARRDQRRHAREACA